MATTFVLDRPALVRRSRRLNYATMAYNSLESILAVTVGVLASSVALVGFGIDSLIELSAGAAALWRLHADHDLTRRAAAEHRTLRLIGISFLALAAYIGADSIHALATRAAPEESWIGIVIAGASLVIMPFLARAKGSIAMRLGSGALAAEAKQTMICT